MHQPLEVPLALEAEELAASALRKVEPRQAASPLPRSSQEAPENIISRRFQVPPSLPWLKGWLGGGWPFVCEKVDSGCFQILWVVLVGTQTQAES